MTIETGNVVLEEHYARQSADAKPGAYVLPAVSDTGIGIPVAILERVRTVFHDQGDRQRNRTRLSMVYGFIRQSNGHIKIYSEVGHGTTGSFICREAETTARGGIRLGDRTGPGGNETVLVVEDDGWYVISSCSVRQLGYRTRLAGNGRKPLAALGDGRIDLPLTDVILPGALTGKQVADAASGSGPGLKVLFMSGYTENAIVHHGRL